MDHVLLLEYRQSDCPQIEYKSKAKRLFVILSHLDDGTPAHDGRTMGERTLRGMTYMAYILARSCRFHQSPPEVILVNFGKIEELLDSSTADRKGSFEVLCRKRIDSYTPRFYTAERGQTWRTAAEANAAVTFITMKEYLKEYDWNGVYTQEEVDDLLQEDLVDEE